MLEEEFVCCSQHRRCRTGQAPVVVEYTLGRIDPPVDVRDERFPMALHLAAIPPKVYTSRYWLAGKAILAQGNLGACVGMTGANWMQNSPVRDVVTNQTGFDLYQACKAIDGFPTMEGTFARALMQVLVNQGRIFRYLWATNGEELKDWVLTTGPVMIGVPWYESMFDPAYKAGDTAAPWLSISGNVVGGHEFLVRAYSRPRDAYRMRNSWGPNWGHRSEAWISRADLNRLVFSENGDACAADERKTP